MRRYKKQMNSMERAKYLQGAYPWWYYLGVIVAGGLFIGRFGNEIKLIGYILFFVVVSLGWKWRVNRK